MQPGSRTPAYRNLQESPRVGISTLVPSLKEPGEVLRTAQQWEKSPLLSCGKRRRWSVISSGNSLGPYSSSWSPQSHQPQNAFLKGCGLLFRPIFSHSLRTKFLWRYLQLTFSQVRFQTSCYGYNMIFQFGMDWDLLPQQKEKPMGLYSTFLKYNHNADYNSHRCEQNMQ